MEEDFEALYQRLIRRLEPDPARLRERMENLLALLEGVRPPVVSQIPLQSGEKCGIGYSKGASKTGEKAGNEA